MPWCICGDFNFVLGSKDQKGGQPLYDNETRDFKVVMDNLNLMDMKAMGRHFTWTNKHV